MMRNRTRKTAGLMLATALVGASVAPAKVMAWDPPQPITTSGEAASSPGAMTSHQFTVDAGLRTFVAYQEPVGDRLLLFVKVSDDGGVTWSEPRRISSNNAANEANDSLPALASGQGWVHVAFVSERADGSSKVIYRASQSGRPIWRPNWMGVSPAGHRPGQPAIARDGQQQMAIAWTDQLTGSVNVRVFWIDIRGSLGLEIWTPTFKLGSSTNRPWSAEGNSSIDALPTVAIARGVINVAYYTSGGTLVLRRSGDHGATWTAPITLARNGDGRHPRLVSMGNSLVVGYASDDGDGLHTTFRRSTDRGRTWSAPRVLSGEAAPPSNAPVLSQRDGTWRAAFERCTDEGCTSSEILYRESDDGLAWGPATTLSGPNDFQSPIGIGFEDGSPPGAPLRPLLAFLSLDAATDARDVMFSADSP
jgi:hypothetical protein